MGDGLPDRLRPTGANRPPPRILHLGLGAFFRAHVCSYLADLGGWGVTGVSLRSAKMRDRLAPQAGVYTAVELGPDGAKSRVIEVVRRVLVAPDDPQAVIDAMADPATEIVSLTITEKGYCHDPATGRLNSDHPDIRHDVSSALPRSAPGYIVRGLQARRSAGLPPFTVLSCDNLPDNGAVTRQVVISLARLIDPDLADWIDAEGAFPSSMVDRIVPATTDDDIAQVARMTGRHDAAPVMHEPFRQWVIEDRFAGARPAVDTVGAQFTDRVAPFEDMKLRMLNGAHSALAYLGYLSGHKTVAVAVADPVLAAYLRYLWRQEIIPTLTPPPDTDLSVYADALMVRFANKGIRHATHQIAMDGSQKLPQRLLGTIRDRLDAGGPVDGLLLAVAAWMKFVSGTDEAGNPIEVQDPLADHLRAAHAEDAAQTVRNLLSVGSVFDETLARRMAPLIIPIYERLVTDGARASMARIAR